MLRNRPIIIILGPTASGKTTLGINLAQKLGTSVISADSRQIYTGFNIGTAKPQAAHASATHTFKQADDIEDVPHYLLNICEPTASYSVAAWQRDAYQLIDEHVAHENPPIIVGGTMLYLDSIIKNFAMPPVPPQPDFREAHAMRPTIELYQELLSRDPDAQNFIEPHNQRRIIRALEVMHVTGQTFSSLRQQREPKYQLAITGLFPGWDTLRETITQRVAIMIKDGLINEVRALIGMYSASLPLLKTLNYQEACQFIDGKITESEMNEQMISANVRYAHRQMSWWKHQPNIEWLPTLEARDILTNLTNRFSL